MSNFDFLANLPILIFTFVFIIVFIIFIRSGIILFKAKKNDEEGEERGSKALLNSLYAFLTILIIALVFFSVSYFLKKGDVLRPSEIPAGEFPPSLSVYFPPPPPIY